MAELQVPQIDFSSLGRLPQVYQQAQANQLRQQTLASLGQGGQADAAALLRSGDLSLAQLGIGLQNTEYQHGRDAKNDTRQAQQDALNQQYRSATLALQTRAADRADDPTPANFVKDPNVPGGYRPIGPADPAYLEQVSAAKARAAAMQPPDGFARGADGSYAPLPGGPQDPAYLERVAAAKARAGGETPEYGLNPIYGVDAAGKPAVVQLSKSGKPIQPSLPEGFQISKDPIRVDAGTHINLIDPQTRQIVGTLPKDVAGVERAKETGSAQGAAEVALPQVIANSEQILKTLDTIDKHPGKQYSLGIYSKAPTIPGTAQADFRANIDQLAGQGFLQAYQTLKGGGAITDIEGAKGTNALMRMQTAQTQESFNQGLKDFREVVKGGMERAKAKARGGVPAPQTTRLKFNPETGALE